MRQSLSSWIADADLRINSRFIGSEALLPDLDYQPGREWSLYVSLLGEAFDMVREGAEDSRDWATVGRGFALLGKELRGKTASESSFFGAASYYLGGYSSSAYLTMNLVQPEHLEGDEYLACYDLLARPREVTSEAVAALISALDSGSAESLYATVESAEAAVPKALLAGPDPWISAQLLASLLQRFSATNVRSVLPDGSADRWTPLIRSLLERRPPVWDFFPSQIQAIEAGLLSNDRTYSLQMPTGAGKTGLTETLIYGHLSSRPTELAVLLVPYRSLAHELRASLGRRLTRMGLATRAVFGGTVPSPEERQNLEEVRVIIATPEAFTGLLESEPELLARLTLVVCDEGHLLDAGGRGIGLELLLSRFLLKEPPPRVIFVSAIVPNIEEINAWLGGNDDTVVRSDFRPSESEFAVLKPEAHKSLKMGVDLEIKAPPGTTLPARTIPNILRPDDFYYLNEETSRRRTWKYTSVKAQAVAVARKYLPMGTVAVYASTKRGAAGVMALARELIAQLDAGIDLPVPNDSIRESSAGHVVDAIEYLRIEYGDNCTMVLALKAGAVVHHGDLPQETREVLEGLVRQGHVPMVFCTSTLAEGVNLPIRTLVLYSTSRRVGEVTTPMPIRDIKNLVGRAGRAGSSTKGMVICANPSEWRGVAKVADGLSGEAVTGALSALVKRLLEQLSAHGQTLTNHDLEEVETLFPLVDGIDATLLELLHGDLGRELFEQAALDIARRTFAYLNGQEEERHLLELVFRLRCERVSALRETGRLALAIGSGARLRLVDSVMDQLIPSFEGWALVESALDPSFLYPILDWAWQRPEMQRALSDSYGRHDVDRGNGVPDKARFGLLVMQWLQGDSFARMAELLNDEVDEILRTHSRAIAYSLTSLVEQAVTIITRHFADTGLPLGVAASSLPDFLRYGVSTSTARALMAGGLRHRRAAVLLSQDSEMAAPSDQARDPRDVAADLLQAEPGRWRAQLGNLVFQRTLQDLGEIPPDSD